MAWRRADGVAVGELLEPVRVGERLHRAPRLERDLHQQEDRARGGADVIDPRGELGKPVGLVEELVAVLAALAAHQREPRREPAQPGVEERLREAGRLLGYQHLERLEREVHVTAAGGRLGH
ncbi:MAG TPA: hypothetical protein PK095_10960, partial [Myxococcota bacterium]|nr:hypothetical protein [Myxococcota bacterium]